MRPERLIPRPKEKRGKKEGREESTSLFPLLWGERGKGKSLSLSSNCGEGEIERKKRLSLFAKRNKKGERGDKKEIDIHWGF